LRIASTQTEDVIYVFLDEIEFRPLEAEEGEKGIETVSEQSERASAAEVGWSCHGELTLMSMLSSVRDDWKNFARSRRDL
jgi:hypothetical protein